jgi:hypothetical protein
LKNEGISGDVIENTDRKISAPGHPAISMKIQDLFLYSGDVYENKGA